MSNQTQIPIDQVKPLGYSHIEHVPKSSYRDTSMVVIIPSREPYLHTTFVQALYGLSYPMNQKRALFYVSGAEVGKAYDELIQQVLKHPEMSNWKYVLTLEDDTVPPPDAVMRLLESIEQGPYDGVGGMYFTKGEIGMPMCYGDPVEYLRTGVLDFRPRNVASALRHGAIIECNGIANGCSLYRMQSFKDVPGPWFQTVSEGGQMTQDLYWCSKARRAGKKFAVDCRVRCAHWDWRTNTAY